MKRGVDGQESELEEVTGVHLNGSFSVHCKGFILF